MKKKVGLLLMGMLLLTSVAACKDDDSAAAPEPTKSTVTAQSSKTEKEQETSASSASKESSELPKTAESTTASGKNESYYFDLMIEAAQSQLPALKEQMGDMYTDITITGGENHTIIYTYTAKEHLGYEMDTAALKPVLVKGLAPVLDSVKGMFPDAKIQVIYLAPDQSEIGNITITQEDVQAEAGEIPA